MPTTDPVTIPIRGKDELTPALKSAQGGMTGFVNSIKASASGLQDLRAGIGFINDGLRIAEQAYAATVGEALKYSDTIRKISRITGESAEETSRLIQLTDDLGVETSDLEAAMSAAARNGIAFTTESIAQLADKYVALSDPVARNTLLIDNFGRSGLNMAGAMIQGGDAIRSMASAVDQNLILTDAQVQASRELEIQLDNMNDAWAGITVQAGTAVIPTLGLLATASNNSAAAVEKASSQWGGLLGHFPPLVAWYALAGAQSDILKGKMEAEAKAVDTSATALAKKYSALDRNPNMKGWSDPNWVPPVKSSSWGQQTTMTVKNDATLNVKITATGLDAGSNWQNVIQKTIRDMQSAGLIPKATR